MIYLDQIHRLQKKKKKEREERVKAKARKEGPTEGGKEHKDPR